MLMWGRRVWQGNPTAGIFSSVMLKVCHFEFVSGPTEIPFVSSTSTIPSKRDQKHQILYRLVCYKTNYLANTQNNVLLRMQVF